jgi:nitroimidazol reductase NimA-like FMN-containing flavoprotein (pyridoxamine 5'-phosphate oxidase superfamily)
MPGYGILPPDGGRGLLPWTWAEQRLAGAHNYWVASSRPDGTPHLMPVWGVWVGGALYFSTGRHSRKARNLVRSPRCSVSTEGAEEAVIVEGRAAECEPDGVNRAVYDAYQRKYGSPLAPELGPIFAVRPLTAFGFIEHDAEFSGSATRWTFAEGQA